MHSMILGLYWNARQQSLDECSERCLHTLFAMRDTGFDGFFQLGRSRGNALQRPLDVSLDGVRALLVRGVNRRDDNREVIPELGYSMSLWSGRPDDEAFGRAIHCGSYSQWVGNNVTLDFPPTGPHSLDKCRGKAEDLFAALVAVWQPEQAILCNVEGRIPADIVALKRYESIV